MKIAIISDIHDNLANLEKFLSVFKQDCAPSDGTQDSNRKVESCGIICCGDVTTPETLEWLAENFSGPIKLACGNIEIRLGEFAEIAKRHKNLEVFEEVGEWEIPGPKTDDGHWELLNDRRLFLAFVHRPDKTEELAKTGKYNFVFYGHTHKPWISGEGTIVANPGTLGGVFTEATFAVLDSETGNLQIKKLY